MTLVYDGDAQGFPPGSKILTGRLFRYFHIKDFVGISSMHLASVVAVVLELINFPSGPWTTHVPFDMDGLVVFHTPREGMTPDELYRYVTGGWKLGAKGTHLGTMMEQMKNLKSQIRDTRLHMSPEQAVFFGYAPMPTTAAAAATAYGGIDCPRSCGNTINPEDKSPRDGLLVCVRCGWKADANA